MPHILDWRKINQETDFRYHQPKSSETHDGFSVRVEVLDHEKDAYFPFTHVGPKMSIPFGLKRKDSQYGPRFNCDMCFPGVKKVGGTMVGGTTEVPGNYIGGEYIGDPDMVDYLKFAISVEQGNKSRALAQCMTWFKKSLTKEIIDEFYFKNIMFPNEPEKYSPVFSTRIQWANEEFKTVFYNQFRKQIKYDDIGKGLQVIPLLTTPGLWFAGKSFGMNFRVVQLMVFERDQFVGCCIDSGFAADNTSIPRPLLIDSGEEDDMVIEEEKRSPDKHEAKAVVAGFNLQPQEPVSKRQK